MVQELSAHLRHVARVLAYGNPLTRGFIGRLGASPPNSSDNAALWDRAMTETEQRAYLGGNISIDMRNAVIATLVRHHAKPKPHVLDIACASGSLCSNLPSYSRYLGIDVSSQAIKLARELHHKPRTNFYQRDLREYSTRHSWNVIVLAECLYYFPVDEAIFHVKRLSESLAEGGIIILSMKNDGKSEAIYTLLRPHLKWVDGALFQMKPSKSDYSIRINRERPAWLVGVLTR